MIGEQVSVNAIHAKNKASIKVVGSISGFAVHNHFCRYVVVIWVKPTFRCFRCLAFEAPFTDINLEGVAGLFDHAVARKIISLIETINHNAEAA
jgi:hypothetical protein